MSTLAESVDVANIPEVEGRSPRQLFWERFKQDKAAIASAVFIIVLVLVAIFAGVIAKYLAHGHGPNELFALEAQDEFGLPKGPNSQFYFGGDNVGRDVFVRVLYGARTSLLVALVATVVAVTIGVIVGIISGFFRGASTPSSPASSTSSSPCRSCSSRSASSPHAAPRRKAASGG